MEKRLKLELPEEVLVKILAGLTLRSIARFRSVCKEWKLIVDSDFFRDFYEIVNPSSSSSWSIINYWNRTESLEIVGHHGCERWGLTNSLGSWIKRHNPETRVKKTLVLSCVDGLVLLYTETTEERLMYHVGNPLLQQWARIPLPPHLSAFDVVRSQESPLFSDTGLVTKMERGIVVSYKVVWMLSPYPLCKELTLMIHSSETGLWTTQKVRSLRSLFWYRLDYKVPLNGILHWLATRGNSFDVDYVISYDFFNGGGDECRIIPFPATNQVHNQCFKRTISTSAGSVVYCNVFNDNAGGRVIKVWKLVSYSKDDDPKAWKLLWKLNTMSSLVGLGPDYFPVVMHPFNSDIIYLWSRNKDSLVLLNLRTRKFVLHKEDEENKSMDGCIMRLSGCKEYMDLVYPIYINTIYGSDLPLPLPLLPRPLPLE